MRLQHVFAVRLVGSVNLSHDEPQLSSKGSNASEQVVVRFGTTTRHTMTKAKEVAVEGEKCDSTW